MPNDITPNTVADQKVTTVDQSPVVVKPAPKGVVTVTATVEPTSKPATPGSLEEKIQGKISLLKELIKTAVSADHRRTLEEHIELLANLFKD